MRAFTEPEQALLRVVDQFDQIEKYQGLAPEEFLLGFRDKVANGLLDDGMLEKVKLKAFGQKVKGLRFTEAGKQRWMEFSGQEERLPVITKVGLLLRDVFNYNRLSYTGEAVPKQEILRHHHKSTLFEAFDTGLMAKVKIKQAHREVVKGYIVTGAGYAYLKGNKLI